MQLVWLRNDLRLDDHPALHGAASARDGVLAVAVLTPEQWRAHDAAPGRIAFWLATLRRLQDELAARNIGLRVLSVRYFADIPARLLQLARDSGARGLWFNREHPLDEARRDARVIATFRAAGFPVTACNGDCVLPPGSLATAAGTCFRVFTPFARAWRRELAATGWTPLPPPDRQPALPAGDAVPESLPGWPAAFRADLWPAGGAAARRRLAQFVARVQPDYADRRDFPASDGTSGLSPYLACGALSARQCVAAVAAHAGPRDWLGESWINELIWRDFFRHLIAAFPDLSRWRPFRPEVEARIRWADDAQRWQAWCRGETGFALVDAGMRQLLATGWMHNRVRMIVASFLTKLLGVDWRLGARFFMRHLIDGDFASNLGGWQWCASVGADAAPYFRIFNPSAQGRRFDPEGDYLARWLPELAGLPPARRHDPAAATAAGRPAPIIDYRAARAASLAGYRAGG